VAAFLFCDHAHSGLRVNRRQTMLEPVMDDGQSNPYDPGGTL
jgi:hypothetical protein